MLQQGGQCTKLSSLKPTARLPLFGVCVCTAVEEADSGAGADTDLTFAYMSSVSSVPPWRTQKCAHSSPSCDQSACGQSARTTLIAERGRLAATIRDEPQVYEAAEEQFITHVQDKLGGLKEEGFKELDSPDHNVKMHSTLVEGSSTGVLRASTVRVFPPLYHSIPH